MSEPMSEPMHTLMIRVAAFEKAIPQFSTVAERDAYHAMIGKLVLYGLPSGQCEDQNRFISLYINNPREAQAVYYDMKPCFTPEGKYNGGAGQKFDQAVDLLRGPNERCFVMGAIKDHNGEWSTHS